MTGWEALYWACRVEISDHLTKAQKVSGKTFIYHALPSRRLVNQWGRKA